MAGEVLTAKTIGGLKIGTVGELPDLINMMVYGDPGVGKTVFAGSASSVEALSPVLYIDVEGGTLSLRERYPNVDVVRITNFDQLGELFGELRSGRTPYKTVVLDSITEIQKFGMYAVMKRAIEKDGDRDPDLPGIGEWGKNTEQMRRLIRAFRDLPMNTIFIALAATDVDKRSNKLFKPSLSAKLSNEVAGFLDIVVFMYKKGDDNGDQHRLLLTLGTDTHIAKDRTDRLPPTLEEPDMKTVYDILFANQTKDSN